MRAGSRRRTPRARRHHGSGRLRGDGLAGRAHHVARHLDVDGARYGEAAAQHARDLARRAARVVEPGLVAGDFAEDPELRVQGLRLVVQQQSRAGLSLAGRARYDDDGRLFRVRARHGVHDIERSRAIGDGGHAERAVRSRRRVRGEADRRLVRERIERKDPRGLDDLEEGQREIAGDAEDLSGAVGLKRVQQGFGELHLRSGAGIGSEAWHTGGHPAKSSPVNH
jgi:hypothetical protein